MLKKTIKKWLPQDCLQGSQTVKIHSLDACVDSSDIHIETNSLINKAVKYVS